MTIGHREEIKIREMGVVQLGVFSGLPLNCLLKSTKKW